MPKISPDGTYNVMQAARLLGIDRRTLRRYESAGLVVAHINDMGRRKYDGRQLIRLWQMGS